MKTVLFLLSCFIPLAASAQKLVATAPATTYHVGTEKAFLYRTPADTTAGKSGSFLYPGAEATVVGEFSPRWLIVKRDGFLYLTPAQKLLSDTDVNLAAGLPIDPQTKLITYQGVVEVPGVSKADLYTRAYAWVAKAYRSANDVIQMQDKEAGQLVAKGLARVTIRSLGMDAAGGTVRHSLTIYVKDGRYKYVLTDFIHESSGAPNVYSTGPLEQSTNTMTGFGKMGGKAWDGIKKQTNQDARRLVADLQSAMTLKGARDPSDF